MKAEKCGQDFRDLQYVWSADEICTLKLLQAVENTSLDNMSTRSLLKSAMSVGRFAVRLPNILSCLTLSPY